MSWLSICNSCPPTASRGLVSAPTGLGVCAPPGPRESKNLFLRSDGCESTAGRGRVSFSFKSYHCYCQRCPSARTRNVPVCSCSELQDRRCGGMTNMQRKIYLRYRRATTKRTDVGSRTCTRPVYLAILIISGMKVAYINDWVCGTREEQLLVLGQTQAEDAAFVRVYDFPPFVCIEAVYLSISAQLISKIIDYYPRESPHPVSQQKYTLTTPPAPK